MLQAKLYTIFNHNSKTGQFSKPAFWKEGMVGLVLSRPRLANSATIKINTSEEMNRSQPTTASATSPRSFASLLETGSGTAVIHSICILVHTGREPPRHVPSPWQCNSKVPELYSVPSAHSNTALSPNIVPCSTTKIRLASTSRGGHRTSSQVGGSPLQVPSFWQCLTRSPEARVCPIAHSNSARPRHVLFICFIAVPGEGLIN